MLSMDTAHLSTWLFLAATMASTTMADYPCICSYAVDTSVYSKADTSSAVIGQMYEFDCKPEYTASPDFGPDWDTIMIDKQIGYLHTSSAMSKSTCQGSIPIEDKVTTSQPTTPTTTRSTSTTASSTVTTSSTSSITSTPATSSGAPITSSKAPIPSSTVTQTVSSFTAAPTNSSNNGKGTTDSSTTFSTDRSSPSMTASQAVTTVAPSQPTSQSSTTATTIPSSSSSTTSKATTQAHTTSSPTTKQSTSTSSSTTTTTSTTRKPTTHHYNQHVTTHAPQMTYTCPSQVIHAAAHNHGATAVYGSTCYELVPGQYHWQDAETNCRNKGGYLVHIRNEDEESHVMSFLYNHGFKHAVWLGLTDMLSENHFRWTSGDPVTFTKWLPGHTSNFESHHYEDCVVLVPYIHTGFFHRSYGLWDDIDCTARQSWICQFDAVPPQGFGGIGNSPHGNLHFTTKTPIFGSLGHILDLIGRK